MIHRSAKTPVKNGLVFVQGSELNKLDDSICQIMQSSQAIISHSVDAKDLFTKIISKVKAEVESEEDKNKKDKDEKKDKKI
jgi:hypothetical protein